MLVAIVYAGLSFIIKPGKFLSGVNNIGYTASFFPHVISQECFLFLERVPPLSRKKPHTSNSTAHVQYDQGCDRETPRALHQ